MTIQSKFERTKASHCANAQPDAFYFAPIIYIAVLL